MIDSLWLNLRELLYSPLSPTFQPPSTANRSLHLLIVSSDNQGHHKIMQLHPLPVILLVLVPFVLGWSPTLHCSSSIVPHRSQPIRNAYKQNRSRIDNRHSKPKQINRHGMRRRDQKSPSSEERTVVILYHKPANVITSHSSNDEVPNSALERRRTVYEDVYSMNGYVGGNNEMSKKDSPKFEEVTGIKSKLHAIGRLDADTTGLLLLTNDGALVHRITNPTSKDANNAAKKSIQKTYEAVIMGYHTLDESTASTNPLSVMITEGVDLPQKYGGKTKPVDNLSILSHPTRTTTCVSITISEGKNRQIRRMFHAVGSGVMKLHRVSVGDVTLGDLREGEWRLLSDDEVLNDLGYKCRHLDADVQSKMKRRATESTSRKSRR